MHTEDHKTIKLITSSLQKAADSLQYDNCYPLHVGPISERWNPAFVLTYAITVSASGDIAEMHGVPLAHHSFGAFLIDSHSASRHIDPSDRPLYAQHVNMMNRSVQGKKRVCNYEVVRAVAYGDMRNRLVVWRRLGMNQSLNRLAIIWGYNVQ